MNEARPPSLESADAVRALRTLLADAGYTTAGVQARLGTDHELLVRPADYAVHLRRLQGDRGALATLVRIFVLLASSDPADVDTALAPLGAAGLMRLGLVRPLEDKLVAAVRLLPHGDLVVASDLPGSAGSQHVPGVQRPSATLANLTVRRQVERALDVGTGNGIQALLAAPHAAQVVATDVSERALEYAAFNLALNAVQNVELRQGSLLDAVAGERFDLVVSNPPYVISPESAFLYRDSGMGGDRVSESLVRSLPDVLTEGGYASVMVSWVQSGGDPAARPRSWLEGSDCDAWILHTLTDDPLSTAASWNKDAQTAQELDERIGRWLDYYDAEGIEAVSYGALVMRRHTGPTNWFKTTQLPRERLRPAGHHLERLFAAQDFLGAPEPLRDARLKVPPDVVFEQRSMHQDGRWTTRDAELRLDGGLGFAAGLDSDSTQVVIGLDPQRPLSETLADVAAQVGADREEFEKAGVALVRQMLELGFIVPV